MNYEESKRAYERDGYFFARGLFDGEEATLLRDYAAADRSIRENVLAREDGEGGSVRISIWRGAGDDLLGLAARSGRVVDAAERCVGEEVYLWHTKVIQKDAGVGGAWVWHQDYGYWYNDKVLEPKLVSCFIALDPATKENGCLQVLRGSHALGRIDHAKEGDQSGAEPARIEAAQERFELVHCEMDAGDALFLHCNLLHRSDQNRSPHRRWALIACYNAASNSPFGETWQPSYSPLEKVGGGALKAASKNSEPAGTSRSYLER